MKLMVVGLGQCGSRIADEFARLGYRALRERRAQIITGCFAVNTDKVDLTGLATIRSDYMHRILIGSRKTGGHGVGKINEMGAELAREDGDKVVDAVRTAKNFYETDAFLLVAGGAGGTGSGAIAPLTQMFKQRYSGKPVYALIVLPFEHEELSELRCIYNTATCLKSVYQAADAVLLVDNQRYVRKDATWGFNLLRINQQIAETFYDLLCAGEVIKYKHVGAKTMDAGDIIQSLAGWTVIGVGRTELPRSWFPWFRGENFRDKGRETLQGVQALEAALSELSVSCDPSQAGRGLYLLAAPAEKTSMGIIKTLGDTMRELAENAVIRGGDFPGEMDRMDVTLIFSQLAYVAKVRNYYDRATAFVHNLKERQKEAMSKLKDLDDAAKELPSFA